MIITGTRSDGQKPYDLYEDLSMPQIRFDKNMTLMLAYLLGLIQNNSKCKWTMCYSMRNIDKTNARLTHCLNNNLELIISTDWIVSNFLPAYQSTAKIMMLRINDQYIKDHMESWNYSSNICGATVIKNSDISFIMVKIVDYINLNDYQKKTTLPDGNVLCNFNEPPRIMIQGSGFENYIMTRLDKAVRQLLREQPHEIGTKNPSRIGYKYMTIGFVPLYTERDSSLHEYCGYMQKRINRIVHTIKEKFNQEEIIRKYKRSIVGTNSVCRCDQYSWCAYCKSGAEDEYHRKWDKSGIERDLQKYFKNYELFLKP